jgi:uncharacterized membrane protein (DUF106 family)
MLMKKPRHRVFDYTPRFYDPQKDDKEREKLKKRLQFSKEYSKLRKKKRSPILWIVFIIVIIYAYLKLSGM